MQPIYGDWTLNLELKLVMGPGQIFDPGRVGSAIEFQKFPPKHQIFQFFSLRVKKIVGKYPGQSRVGLLFTAGQK